MNTCQDMVPYSPRSGIPIACSPGVLGSTSIGSPVPIAHTQRLSTYSQQSHELQLVGGAGPINYVAGLYTFKDDGFTNNPQNFFFGSATFDSRYGFTTKANSAYGQLDYKLSDALTLTGGVRHTKEDKTVSRLLSAGTTPLIPG